MAKQLHQIIDELPDSDLAEVFDFIGYIKLKRRVPETMLMSEAALSEYWDTPEEDEAWADL
jgi:hypothetical protein